MDDTYSYGIGVIHDTYKLGSDSMMTRVTSDTYRIRNLSTGATLIPIDTSPVDKKPYVKSLGFLNNPAIACACRIKQH